ncbi:MAG TPA: HAD-IA family hydrolase [Burkholderiaceae bacterium]
MVSADDVSVGKPLPEIYRTAAARLGFAAADCLAFEDAPAGVASALAAGCAVVQVDGKWAFDPRVNAVVPHLGETSIRCESEMLLLALP